MEEEGSGLSSVELKAVPGFGFLPNDVVQITDLLFQVKTMQYKVYTINSINLYYKV